MVLERINSVLVLFGVLLNWRIFRMQLFCDKKHKQKNKVKVNHVIIVATWEVVDSEN